MTAMRTIEFLGTGRLVNITNVKDGDKGENLRRHARLTCGKKRWWKPAGWV